MANEQKMTDAEKQAARLLMGKVALYLGLKVALYVGIHFAMKRLLRSVESDVNAPFDDEMAAYSEKDTELITNLYRPFIVREDGN